MGKAEATVACQVPGERLPLLCQAAPSATYLSQEEVVQQAGAAPWRGLRRALLCLLGAFFACLLATALLLLFTMPRPPPPLTWWQKASFYYLPPTSFPDSNSDGRGDLEGVRSLLDQLVELPIQALVLGPILEEDSANLSRICSAHGSLEQLQVLVADGQKQGIRVLLELPTWAEEELDSFAEDNRTIRHLQRTLRFWQAQGVRGFLVAKDPAWRLDAVLDAWTELGRQTQKDHGEERVLMVWDQGKTCNISRWVPSTVILTCNLPGTERNLTSSALTQRVEEALRYPGGPWPGWTAAGGLPMPAELEKIFEVLLLSLPGTPLLQGGPESPISPVNIMGLGTNGHPLTTLYHSLLPLHATSFALQGAGFAPLSLPGHPEDIFAFLRPGACSDVLVVLNLGSQPRQLDLSQLNSPNHAKVLFSTHPKPQSEVKMEEVTLAPHQALLLRVHSR